MTVITTTSGLLLPKPSLTVKDISYVPLISAVKDGYAVVLSINAALLPFGMVMNVHR